MNHLVYAGVKQLCDKNQCSSMEPEQNYKIWMVN